MKATTMLIAASIVALAGVSAIPSVAAAPPFSCGVNVDEQPQTWILVCSTHTEVIEYCLTSDEVQADMREECIDEHYFGR